ncbi:ankyrin repeat-containing domain protein, partial [Dactylonectria estremocensis]
MQENHLRRGKTKKQLEDDIAKTPVGLERLYDRNWEKIAGLEEEDKTRAISLLRWAAFALRPLTVCEITEAVIIHEDCDDFPLDELPDPVDDDYIESEILDLCGPLLEVRSQPSEPTPAFRTVHLTHFSVKQYLLYNILAQEKLLLANERLRASNEAIESTLLAKLCLHYISFPQVWQGTLQEPLGTLGKSFRDYAAGSWYRHANLGVSNDADIIRLTNVLLDRSNPTWNLWREWFDSNDDEVQDNDEESMKAEPTKETRPPSPLYYASKLGLTATAIYLIKERRYDANETSSLGRTALGASCAKGNVTMVKVLLDAKANVTVANYNSWTPVHIASSNGHVEVVKLLLNKGADITVATKDGVTPLHGASLNGHVEVVKLLLKHPDIEATSKDG